MISKAYICANSDYSSYKYHGSAGLRSISSLEHSEQKKLTKI